MSAPRKAGLSISRRAKPKKLEAPSAMEKTEELLQQLVERLTQPEPALPIQYDAWDVDHIARYMKRTPDTVRREIVTDPSFPKPMRPPSSGRAHGLWPARKVVAWLEARA